MRPDYGQIATRQWEARRHRDAVLGRQFAGEAAWDMLLYLRASAKADRRVSVSAACSAAGVPPTTALRALAAIVKQGLVRRMPDGGDRRRYFLELTVMGFRQLELALSPPDRAYAPGYITQAADGCIYLRAADRRKTSRGFPPQIAEAEQLVRRALALLGEVNP